MNARPQTGVVLGGVFLAIGCASVPNNETTTVVHGNRSGLLHTMSEDGIATLQLLIIQPLGSTPGWNGSDFTMTLSKATERFTWDVAGTQRVLSVTYDAYEQELEVAGSRWNVASGNTFVIWLDDAWAPSVRQLPLHIEQGSDDAILASIREAVPEDEDIASLQPDRKS